MAIAGTITARDDSWLQALSGLIVKPARLQIAALCYRPGDTEPEVLLVTSREKGRLILPKGWPINDKPAPETAVIEAYEEAGIVGKVSKSPVGRFRSFKGLSNDLKIRTSVLVFKIKVDKVLEDFPEVGQRQLHWLPLSEAILQADELALRRFLKRHGSKLT